VFCVGWKNVVEKSFVIQGILMTWSPWRGDEEYTLLHEIIHVLLYDFDKFNENKIFIEK